MRSTHRCGQRDRLWPVRASHSAAVMADHPSPGGSCRRTPGSAAGICGMDKPGGSSCPGAAAPARRPGPLRTLSAAPGEEDSLALVAVQWQAQQLFEGLALGAAQKGLGDALPALLGVAHLGHEAEDVV